ncbi:conserved repeat domain-containing protein [Frankineae bacterium MT45]|nr:conserved repeat domain-containing protein [Frankineae bacterium MT45]
MAGLCTLLLVATLVVGLTAVAAVVTAPPAEATPGTPGVPQAPTVLYTERFENGTTARPSILTSYTGPAPLSAKYTADPAWLTECNGQIVKWGSTPFSASNCSAAGNFGRVQQESWALGKHAGLADPTTNNAVTAYTEAPPPGADKVEFQTLNDINLPRADGRFIAFTIDTAAVNCASSAPLYNFYLLTNNDATETQLGSTINACSATPGAQNIQVPATPDGSAKAVTIHTGTYTSNGAVLVSGTGIGLRLRNHNGIANGNDAAFDNIGILDATPQLDKSFSPSTIAVGGSSTLTFTITNTSELGAKNGWSFTDNLPAGLTITSPAATTTCPAGVVTAPPGATKATVSGNLNVNMTSCTATVHVTAGAATGTFNNGPTNIDPSTGLNPPGNSSLTVVTNLAFTCSPDAPAYMFRNVSATNHPVYSIDLATGASTQVGTTTDVIQATGYNTLDNFIYGWDQTLGQLVRLDTNFAIQPLGRPAGTTATYSMGDFDNAGHLYLTTNSASAIGWVEIDLVPNSPTYATVIASGTSTTPSGNTAADWSWINGLFYKLVFNGANAAVLFSFNPSTNATTNLGAVGFNFNTPTESTWSDGKYLYASLASSGQIFRIDPTNVTSFMQVQGPVGTSSDGARCDTSPVPTLMVTKTVGGRVAPADQFRVSLTDANGAALPITSGSSVSPVATTTGTLTTVSTLPWPVDQGSTYTITDAQTSGTGALGGYDTTIACADTTTGANLPTTGTGPTWTVAVTSSDAYTCNVTNAPAKPTYSVTKTVSPATPPRPGATVTYSIAVKNTGKVAYTTASPASFTDDLTGVLDDAAYNNNAAAVAVPAATEPAPTYAAPTLTWSGPLAIGATVTVTYSVTIDNPDNGDETLTNTAVTPPGTGGNCPSGSTNPSCTVGTLVQSYSVVKTADTTVAHPGDTINYTITVTNTGKAAFTDDNPATLTDDLTGVLDDAVFNEDTNVDVNYQAPTFTWSGALDVGQVLTLTYSVTVNNPDTGDNIIRNSVSTPAGSGGNCPVGSADPACTANVPVQAYRVVKSTTATTVTPGDVISYLVTVTNTGAVAYTAAAPASISDDLTAVLDDATYNNDATASSGPAPTFASPVLSWSGPLPVGATVTIIYTVTVKSPDPGDGSLDNSVVTPPGSGGSCPAGSTLPACTVHLPDQAYTVAKSASVAVANPGTKITYTITVTNTGTAAYTAAAPATFTDDLTAVLDDATYNNDATASAGAANPTYAAPTLTWSGPLAVGQVVTVTYSVTINDPDPGDGSLANAVVTPPGRGGDCPAGSTLPACTSTVPVRSYQVTKSGGGAAVEPGAIVTYTVTVVNTGNADYTAASPASFTDDLTAVLDDAVYNNDATASAGAANPTYTAPTLSWSGPLAAGASVVITYTVTVNDPDTGNKSLTNAVVTPPGSGGNCPAGSTDAACSSTVAVQSYAVSKTASVGSVAPGSTVTYTVTVVNTGASAYTAANPASFTDDLSAVLDDGIYNNDAVASDGSLVNYASPSLTWSGPLPLGATVTVTYSVTVNDPDTGDKSLANAVVTPPGSGGDCPTGAPLAACTSTVPVRTYSVTKTASSTTATPGATINYTVAVTNTGEAAYTAATPASFTDDLSTVVDDAAYNNDAAATAGPAPTFTSPTLTWSGPLAVGATVTVTYSVTVNDPDTGDKSLINAVVTPPGSGGNCPTAAAACTVTLPVQSYTVAKAASVSAATAGARVTYTVTVTNVGTVAYSAAKPASFSDDLTGVLDDASYNGDAAASSGPAPTFAAPTLTWAGPLAVGAAVTVTYSVTVKDPDTGDQSLGNAVVTPPGSGGDCPAGSALLDCSVTVPVQSYRVTKTASVGSSRPGATVTYSVSVVNTGKVAYTAGAPASFSDDLTAVLDDAVYNNDAAASAGPAPTFATPTLTWSGPLAVGATITITYSVTVNDPDTGDQSLANAVVTPPGSGGDCPTGSTDPACTTAVPVQSYRVTKTASAATATPRAKITYTVSVVNTGKVAYTAAAPASFTDDLTRVLDDATYNNDAAASTGPPPTFAAPTLSWSGPLAVGATITITYSVTVNVPDAGDQSLANAVVTPPGSGGGCPTGSTTPGCTVTLPVKSFSVTKQASSITATPGATIDYTLTVTNTGEVAYTAAAPASFDDDLTAVLDDAIYNNDAAATTGPAPTYLAPTLHWAGPLAIGATVVVSYSVTVKDPDAGDGSLANVIVTPPGSGGSCPTGSAAAGCKVTVGVQSYSVTKTASTAKAGPGDIVTYTVKVLNTGQVAYTAAAPASITDDLFAVLDDATYNNDATATAGAAPAFAAPVLTWSGPLPVGATVTITYSVTVNSPDTGDGALTNTVLTPPGAGGDCPAGSNQPGCTITTPVQSYTVTKRASTTNATPGATVTYTVTVTNRGQVAYTAAAPASFTDNLTAVLDDARYNRDAKASAGATPTYTAPTLSWSGPLAVGASVTVTYSVTVNDPDTGDQVLANAVVTPPNSGGDCPAGSTAAGCTTTVPVRSFSVTKTTTATTVAPGAVIPYTITVTNTGQSPYTATNPAGFTDDLTTVLDDATYNGDAAASAGPAPTFTTPTLAWSGPLAVGQTITVTYSVTVNSPDTGDKILVNTVVTPPNSGGDCPSGGTNADCTTAIPGRAYSVVKTASTATAAAGGKVTYTITLRNTGATPYTLLAPASFTDDLSGVLDDAVYNNDVAASAGTPKYAAPTISWSGPLPLGGTVTVTYSVTVNNPDTGDQSLANAVVTPPNSGGECPAATNPPGCATSVPVQSYSVVKTSSTQIVDPGDSVTYTIAITNTGAVAYTAANPATFTDDLSGVVDDALYNNDATASSGPAPTYAAPVLSWSGPLAVGATVTVTYSVAVIEPDAGDHVLPNAAVTPPGSGGGCPSGSTNPSCVPPPVRVQDYSVVKTADHTVADPGDTIKYTVVVRNTGQVDFTAADPVRFLDALNKVLDDATYNDDATASAGAPPPIYVAPLLSWSGPLAVGGVVTVTYSVTVNDPDTGDRSLDNAVTTPTALGGCPEPSTPQVQRLVVAAVLPAAGCHPSAIPVRSYTVVKTSSAAPARSGDRVTYQVTVTNTGEGAYTAADPATFTDDLSGVLDDATYNKDADHGAIYAAPVLRWSGTLGVGETVVVTYSVTVNAPDKGDHQLTNAVVGPNCPAGSMAPECRNLKLVQGYDVTKTASAKSVNVGDRVRYTITVTNSGRVAYSSADPASFTDDLTRVLDDATYNNDATAGATYRRPVLSWSGALPVGAVVTVTYSVTVLAPDPGDQLLTNAVVTSPGSGGGCPTTPVNPRCDTTTSVNQQFGVSPIDTGGGGGLALTGSDLRLQLLLAALLFAAGGIIQLMRRRRRRS